MNANSERAALHILQSALDRTLATMPTSLEKDLSILAAMLKIDEHQPECPDDANLRRSIAIEWRIQYKKSLMKCLCLIEKYKLMMVHDG